MIMLGEVLLRLGRLELARTKDNSHTELVLHAHADLGVADVRDLAATLLGWLAEQGHPLPELPALEEDLEPLPEHARG